MKAVLLAAGLGTRLADVTGGDVPKIMVPLGGRPLLAWQLQYLEQQGATAIAINVHHLREQVVDFLASAASSVDVRVSVEQELQGTAGALLPLADFLTEPFLLLYGDVVTDADLGLLLERHRAFDAVATLAYYESDHLAGKGVLELDASGHVVGFHEKPEGLTGRQPINAGIYALDPRILEFVPPGGDFGFDVWPAVTAAGEVIASHRLDAYLADVGSPDALAQVESDLAGGRLKW